jgi:hypothetical protein
MRIFFMHIPKTAGSSFRRFLEHAMRERGARVAERSRDGVWSDTSESYPSYEEFVSPALEPYRSCDLVSGHYPYHVTRLLPADTIVVTVLRDPIERCLSHVKHQMAYERATGARDPEPDVNAFLANPRNEMFLDTISNLAVRYLAGSEPPDAVVTRRVSLDLAVERCLRTVFGFADALERFQARLGRELFERGDAAEPPHFENRSADRFSPAELSPRNRRLLEARNEAEIALVGLMREVAAARWQAEEWDPRATKGLLPRGEIVIDRTPATACGAE